MFSIAVPAPSRGLQAQVLPAGSEMLTTMIAHIQICDVHVVDLHQCVCVRYLVGVKGAETKGAI
jgi:hypothetical protein